MKTIITTVGTSLFENYKKPKVKDLFTLYGRQQTETRIHNPKIEANIREISEKNPLAKDYSKFDIKINEIIKGIKETWLVGVTKDEDKDWAFVDKSIKNIYASAEIESILAIYQEQKQDIEVYLLATDTVLSLLASNIIKEILPSYNSAIKSVSIEVIKGLQVDNPDDFETIGFDGLVSFIQKLKKENKDVVLNITGGYKGVIPIMTILGQLYDIPLNYIYEDTGKLIEIGQLPINFDLSIVELFYNYTSHKNLKNNELSSEEKKIIEDKLILNLNIFKKETWGYKRTIIGDIFDSYVQEKYSYAKTVMGYFVEHKIYEYLLNEPYLNIYTKTTHSDKSFIGKEIDLLIKNGNDFIIGEVKTPYQISFAFDQSKEYNYARQLKEQLQFTKQKNKEPKEYLLYVYKQRLPKLDNSFYENLQKLKKEAKILFPNMKFNVFIIEFELQIIGRDVNVYQGFMRKKFTLQQEKVKQSPNDYTLISREVEYKGIN